MRPGDVLGRRAGGAPELAGELRLAREALGLRTSIASDCAPLAAPVLALIEAGCDLSCLRDLTREGLASAPVENGTIS